MVKIASAVRSSFRPGFLKKEFLTRLALVLVAGGLQFLEPTTARVQPEKWHKYRFPFAKVETFSAPAAAALLCLAAIVNLTYILYVTRRRKIEPQPSETQPGGLGAKPRGKRTLRRLIAYGYKDGMYHLLTLSLAVLSTVVVCETIKRLVGRLRPDFLSRCFDTQDSYTLIQLANSFRDDTPPLCAGREGGESTRARTEQLRDGRMSFPSEHSGTAFAIFMVMALFDFYHIKGMKGYGAEALVFPLFLLLVPLVVSVSRVSDYRHHPSDVFAGVAIGAAAAVSAHFFYQPRRARLQPGAPDPPPPEGAGEEGEEGNEGEEDVEGEAAFPILTTRNEN